MKKLIFFIVLVLSAGCKSEKSEVQTFLNDYNQRYAKLYYASAEAAWKTNTEIREGDTLTAYNSRLADEALTAFTGSIENIEQAKRYLDDKDGLDALQVRQLEAILYNAGSDPQTVAGLVKEKIRASIAQTENLFGYQFTLDG